MTVEEMVRSANRSMIAFDLVLGTGTLLAPDATLRVIGHDAPSDDARELFRRCAPIWLTFVAAHVAAEVRGEPRDWWAVAWLRGTELFTDVLWSRSRCHHPPGCEARPPPRGRLQPRAGARGRPARPALRLYQCTPFMRLAIAICSIDAFSEGSFLPLAAAESGKTL